MDPTPTTAAEDLKSDRLLADIYIERSSAMDPNALAIVGIVGFLFGLVTGVSLTSDRDATPVRRPSSHIDNG